MRDQAAMSLVVSPNGTIQCVYGEVMELSRLGAVEIRRGSFVEPDALGAWWADLCPVNGPKIGPFPRRSDALAAENQWLERHWLTAGS